MNNNSLNILMKIAIATNSLPLAKEAVDAGWRYRTSGEAWSTSVLATENEELIQLIASTDTEEPEIGCFTYWIGRNRRQSESL